MTISMALLLFLAPVLASDLTSRRIPNAHLLAALILSLFAAIRGVDHTELSGWAGGLAVGLVSFLPLYALRLMGAGDVKMMATCGACIGPALAWHAALLALMLGGVLAVLWQLWFRLPNAVLWAPVTTGLTRLKGVMPVSQATTAVAQSPLRSTSARLPFSWPIWLASLCVLAV